MYWINAKQRKGSTESCIGEADPLETDWLVEERLCDIASNGLCSTEWRWWKARQNFVSPNLWEVCVLTNDYWSIWFVKADLDLHFQQPISD